MGCTHSKKEVPYVSPISHDDLMANFGNDEDFVDMIVNEGIKEFEQGIVNMTNALEDKDIVILKLTSHSIKGSAANITCMSMSEMARDIEVLVNGENFSSWSEIRHIIDKMSVELNIITNYQKNRNK